MLLQVFFFFNLYSHWSHLNSLELLRFTEFSSLPPFKTSSTSSTTKSLSGLIFIFFTYMTKHQVIALTFQLTLDREIDFLFWFRWCFWIVNSFDYNFYNFTATVSYCIFKSWLSIIILFSIWNTTVFSWFISFIIALISFSWFAIRSLIFLFWFISLLCL